jgi:hypothetical protein
MNEFQLSSVSFISSRYFIAVHSDSSIESQESTFRLLSPVICTKAEKTASKSRGHADPIQDAVTSDSTEEPLPGRRKALQHCTT